MTSEPTVTRSRRWWIPLTLIAVAVVNRVLWAAAVRAEVGGGVIFGLQFAFNVTSSLAVLGIAVWFFFLSGYSGRLRARVFAGMAALAVVAVAAIRTVEFDGQMRPQLHFRWEPDAHQLLAEHRAKGSSATGQADLTVGPTDSPRFRAANGDGVTAGVTLADWSARPPAVLWKQPCGGGHGGFAVAGNSAVTLEQRGAEEIVVCYDRASGKERWAFAYPAKFEQSEPMGGSGPRATPAIADGLVYSLGAAGELVCLDGGTGRPKWQTNILAEPGAANVQWGLSGSPLVVGGLVVVNRGADAKDVPTVLAFDRLTGSRTWGTATAPAAYSSPQRAVLGGKEQVLVFDAAGLHALDPAGGAKLWSHPWKTPMDMNSAQPVVVGPDRVFLSSEKDNGAAVLEVTENGGRWAVKPVWQHRKFAARYCTPVLHTGFLFGLSDDRLVCLDAATGAVKWKEGSFGNGQVLLAGDTLVVTAERGKVHLVAADPNEFRELGSVPVFNDRTWNTPALAGNQLFVRNHREMACLELPTAAK